MFIYFADVLSGTRILCACKYRLHKCIKKLLNYSVNLQMSLLLTNLNINNTNNNTKMTNLICNNIFGTKICLEKLISLQTSVIIF